MRTQYSVIKTVPSKSQVPRPTFHNDIKDKRNTVVGRKQFSDIGHLGPHYYPGGNAQIDFYKFLPTGQSELVWDGVPLHAI